ncbi:MAG TPA: hypothetical protein ENN51_06335 [candidate division WOR-3 bacterium]|uniref:Uncharacterized protein n=1 Tax=candidate division WOR-3 bacterium TaxID=2052148 RepID=A0A7V0T6L9_UNCW3|nr:hypothetical protein [candidate division WOR-3 bacterium]
MPLALGMLTLALTPSCDLFAPLDIHEITFEVAGTMDSVFFKWWLPQDYMSGWDSTVVHQQEMPWATRCTVMPGTRFKVRARGLSPGDWYSVHIRYGRHAIASETRFGPGEVSINDHCPR